jgi:hypothetical protein
MQNGKPGRQQPYCVAGTIARLVTIEAAGTSDRAKAPVSVDEQSERPAISFTSMPLGWQPGSESDWVS